MEIRIQGDDQSASAPGMLNDFRIGRAIEADVGDVLDVYALALKMTNRAAWQALIQQEPDHAAPKVMI
jgi:hypothetical protein